MKVKGKVTHPAKGTGRGFRKRQGCNWTDSIKDQAFCNLEHYISNTVVHQIWSELSTVADIHRAR